MSTGTQGASLSFHCVPTATGIAFDLALTNADEAAPVIVYSDESPEEGGLWVIEIVGNQPQTSKIQTNLPSTNLFPNSRPSLAIDADGDLHLAYLALTLRLAPKDGVRDN